MNKNFITPQDSQRICSHMNNDHADAVLLYAKFYGGFQDATEADLLEINSKEMKIKANNRILLISFDHLLEDSKDAHQTLVSMIKSIPK